MERKMPKDFYWGGSVSSFQTEGHRNEGGKGVCIYDVRPRINERYGIQLLSFLNLLEPYHS